MKKTKEKTSKKQNSISKEDSQKLKEILEQIDQNDRSVEFLQPVDFKGTFYILQ